MPQFRYRAMTTAGHVVVGQVEAPSQDEVVLRIRYLGYLPIDTAEVSAQGIFNGLRGLGAALPRSRDITIFLRQLALLVGAGLTLEAALHTLRDGANKAVARFCENLRAAISGGEGFAEALERYPSTVEPTYVAMIRAGEASGKLEGVLRAIVEDRARKELLSERINSAVRYPLFLIASAVVILCFFLIYVVPQFEPVFKDLGGRLNAGAALVLSASGWLRGSLDLMLGVCAVFVLFVWLALSSVDRRARVIGVIGSIPGLSGLMQDRRAARIISTLGLLSANGVALPTALKILRHIAAEPRYVSAVDRLTEQVRAGRRFADALADTDLLPTLAVRMLRIGDETGDLSTICAHAAQFYEHRLSVGLDRLMGAVGPATIIFVSVIIGALIISIMTALLSITELAL